MQHAVDAEAHREDALLGLEVDVRGALLHRLRHQVADQLDHRRFLGHRAQLLLVAATPFVGARVVGQAIQHAFQVLRAAQAPVDLAPGVGMAHRLAQGRQQRIARGAEQVAALARPHQHLLVQQPVDPGRCLHRGQARHVLVRRGHVGPHHRQAELTAEHLQQVVLADRADPHQHAADAPADLLLQGQAALEVGGADQPGIEQQLAQQAVARGGPQCGVRGHRRILS